MAKYSEALKAKALTLLESGKPATEVASELEVPASTLRGWRNKKAGSSKKAKPRAASDGGVPTKQQRLDQLLEFLRFPSVSTDSRHKTDMRACADWLVAKLKGMGLSARKHATKGHPVVMAKNQHREGRPTVLIYGHYDVQPAEPLDLWKSPPFEPVVRKGLIYARGSTDNKGQILAHILGVEQAMIEQGDVPVNLTFLIEGEEEIGSPHLEPFLIENKEDLACDVGAGSDTGMA